MIYVISVAVIGILTGYIGTMFFEDILTPLYRIFIRGYHIHHSNIGLVYFALSIPSFLFIDNMVGLLLIGMGSGIILRHTVSEEWVFIEKVSDNFKKTGIILTKDLKEILGNNRDHDESNKTLS